jgi:hypothetical protein
MGESDTAYGARGKVEGGDILVWMCRINLDMVGLNYREFREKRTRLTLLPSASACETPASSAEKITAASRLICRALLPRMCISESKYIV